MSSASQCCDKTVGVVMDSFSGPIYQLCVTSPWFDSPIFPGSLGLIYGVDSSVAWGILLAFRVL